MTLQRTEMSRMSQRRRKELADEGITFPTSTLVARPKAAKAKTASKLPALPKLAVITGEFSPAVRDVIEDRDGHSCGRCGIGVGDRRGLDYSLQHRRARGAGGSTAPDTGQTANGVLLCGSALEHCHGAVEKRGEADRIKGFWVHQYTAGKPTDLTTVPIKHALYGWCLLDNDGGYEVTSAPVRDEAAA